MAGVLQHLRSSTLDKRPNPASMVDGQIAINYASGAPGMFFKDSNGSLVKVGPVHVGSGAPNAVSASGGTAGNSIGEQWLDTSGGTYVFKIWDGAAWRSEAGEFVNATGDTMTGDLVMNNANLVFEGSVDDGFETTLTVVNPTADRTITLPNVTGTVITTGDSGTVTSTMIADGTIVNADVNASAAIAGTKISPNFGSQTVQTTGVFTAASGSESAPAIAFTADTNTGIYSPGADQVAISTNGTGRLFVDSSGNVGVSGRLLVGTSIGYLTSTSATTQPLLQIHSTNTHEAQVSINSWATGTTTGANLSLCRSDSGTVGTHTVVGSTDVLGAIRFSGSDGDQFIEGASIAASADGTWGDNDGPTKLVFSATADGASSPTERMRISNAGTTTLTSAASTAPFIANIGASEVARIDSSGRLLVGTSSAYATPLSATVLPITQIHTNSSADNSAISQLMLTSWSAGTDVGPSFSLNRADSGTIGTFSPAIGSSDVIGNIRFNGSDGVKFIETAKISAVADGTWGVDDGPTRLVFSTSADGASTTTERLRITNDGVQAYNQAAPAAVNATATLTVANLKTGIITSTSAAATDMTLPTGTDTEAGFSGIYTNMTFEWSVINTGPSLVRVLASTAHTIVGSGSVATGTSGRFASRRTAANTFVTYRLS